MAKGLLHNVLMTNTPKVTPNSMPIGDIRGHCQVNNLYYAEGTKTLKITGTVLSDNASHIPQNRWGHKYSVEVDVLNVNRSDGLNDEQLINGFLPIPNLNEKTIQVRCNCESYRFRFAEYNKKNSANAGRMHTIGVTISLRAPNNPYGLPGECKHITAFIDYLIEQGFVTI